MTPFKKDCELVRFLNELKRISEREYILFRIGMWTGLQHGEILTLKKKDVTQNHILKGPYGKIIIHSELQKELEGYLKEKKNNGLLFPSRERGAGNKQKVISTRTIHRNFQRAAREARCKERVGLLTARKTFGYRFYTQVGDLFVLQDYFNHSTIEETKRYLDLEEDV